MYIDRQECQANRERHTELERYPNDSDSHTNELLSYRKACYGRLASKEQLQDEIFIWSSYCQHLQKISNLFYGTCLEFEAHFLDVTYGKCFDRHDY